MPFIARSVGVIPARAQSTRFALKVLAPICGKPLIQWVWEAASLSHRLSRLVIATDEERVAQVARSFGAEAVMTPMDCPSGTDRVFEAIRGSDAEWVVNIQGDEPLLDPASVDALVERLVAAGPESMATLAVPMQGEAGWGDPQVVKLKLDAQGRAIDFFRQGRGEAPKSFLKHIGLYAFHRAALERFCEAGPSRNERLLRLEQWRALENGIDIWAVQWPHNTIAVDVPEDVAKVEAYLMQREEGQLG